MSITYEQMIVAVVVGIGIVAAFIVGKIIDGRRRRKAEDLAARELAVIVEQVDTTAAGNLSLAMLVLSLIGALFGYAAAATVFQQIQVSVGLIAAVILFGLGYAVGRTRTYRVYRSEHREPH